MIIKIVQRMSQVEGKVDKIITIDLYTFGMCICVCVFENEIT